VGGGEKGCSVEVYTGHLLNVQLYSEDALRKGLRGEQTMCAKKEFATNNSQLRTKMLQVRGAFCDVSRSHRGPPHASNTFQNKTPYSGTMHSPSEDRPLGNRSPALSYSEQTTASQEEHFPPNDNTFIQKNTPPKENTFLQVRPILSCCTRPSSSSTPSAGFPGSGTAC
jgi:hypothetical protein